MDATRDYHLMIEVSPKESEVSQKEKQIPYAFTCIWNLKYGTNEPIYKTETGSQTERTHLWLPRGPGGGGGTNRLFGVS